MFFFPVITRELQAESRRPANYFLRLVPGAAALALMTLALGQNEQRGTELFKLLHQAVLDDRHVHGAAFNRGLHQPRTA